MHEAYKTPAVGKALQQGKYSCSVQRIKWRFFHGLLYSHRFATIGQRYSKAIL